MNRISVRGVGFAAVMAASSLSVGTVAAAHSPDTVDPGASTHAATTVALAPLPSRGETWSADLAGVRYARIHGIAQRSASLRAAQLARTHRSTVVRAAASHRVTRAYVRPVAPGSVRALGQRMAAARGWTGMQFACLDSLWTHESHWRVTAYNHSSGALGIPQAAPGTKMASAGSDYRTNPATQIAWGLAYIARAHGNPCGAWSFWLNHHWY